MPDAEITPSDINEVIAKAFPPERQTEIINAYMDAKAKAWGRITAFANPGTAIIREGV